MAALESQLDDMRGFNRLAACEALIMLGEPKRAAGTIASALCGPDSGARVFAEDRLRRRGISKHEVAVWVAPELLDKDANHRQRALDVMMQFASAEELRSALSRASRTDDETVRKWAAEKLETLAAESGGE